MARWIDWRRYTLRFSDSIQRRMNALRDRPASLAASSRIFFSSSDSCALTYTVWGSPFGMIVNVSDVRSARPEPLDAERDQATDDD